MYRVAWLSMFVLCILSGQHMSWAVSQHVFPESNYTDIFEHLPKASVKQDNQLYMYSSLSFPDAKENIKFDISQTRIDHIMPLIVFDMYHDISSSLQAEFLDHTIWGIMGSYFDKSIEEIALENEIKLFFEKIKSVSDKYKILVEADDPELFDIDRVATVSRRHFLTARERFYREVMRKYANANWGEEMLYAAASGVVRVNTSASWTSDDTYGEGSGSSSASDKKKKASQNAYRNNQHFVFKVFHVIQICITYAFTHKIESVIYLFLSFFVLSFAKLAFFGR